VFLTSLSSFLELQTSRSSIESPTHISTLTIPARCLGDRRGELKLSSRCVWPGYWLIKFNRRFNQTTLIDTTPLPAEIPPVQEIGASSAPLLSASFFIGARCKAYNDDFMQCKNDNPGKGEIDCLKEGRRVTRCAKSV
jgi:hypothetical protein